MTSLKWTSKSCKGLNVLFASVDLVLKQTDLLIYTCWSFVYLFLFYWFVSVTFGHINIYFLWFWHPFCLIVCHLLYQYLILKYCSHKSLCIEHPCIVHFMIFWILLHMGLFSFDLWVFHCAKNFVLIEPISDFYNLFMVKVCLHVLSLFFVLPNKTKNF